MFQWLLNLIAGPRPLQPVGRNESCPCGSRKKFKRCCMERTERERRAALSSAAMPDQEAVIGDQSSVADHALKRANRYRAPKG
jgi:hypothetical protein